MFPVSSHVPKVYSSSYKLKSSSTTENMIRRMALFANYGMTGYNPVAHVCKRQGTMKVVDRSKISEVADDLRSEGKKIVFTNGCFDLLHKGHVRYLREARKLGDVLIVGLNSDSSVARIKSGRPLTPENDRAEVLSALSMVDFITLFDEDTPHRLIQKIRPDVLVKGSDWKKEDIVGSDIVKEVHTIPLTEGVSTSMIIETIRNMKRTT